MTPKVMKAIDQQKFSNLTAVTNTRLKKFILLLVVLFEWNAHSIAQVSFATIKLDKTSITSLKLFNLGDSILVSYFDEGSNTHRSNIVHSNGKNEPLFVADVPSQFCGSEINEAQWHLYFFEQKDKQTLILKTLFIDRKNKIRKILENGIIIEGQLIGVYEKNGISIFTWKKSEKILSVYRISGSKYTEYSYVLPDNAKLLDASDFHLMPPNPGWLYQVNGRAKIYFDDLQVKLTIDRRNRTEIITFVGPERETKVTTIPCELADATSFLCDSMLFRLGMYSSGFYVKVFNIFNESVLASKYFKKKDAQDSDKVYFHSGKDDITTYSDKLK